MYYIILYMFYIEKLNICKVLFYWIVVMFQFQNKKILFAVAQQSQVVSNLF